MRNFTAIPCILMLLCAFGLAFPAFGQAPRFKTVEEKQAWQAKHPDAQAPAPAAKQQAQGPVYRDTGHPDADRATFRKEKEAYERSLEAASPAPAQTGKAQAMTPKFEEPNPKKALKTTASETPAAVAVPAPTARPATVRPTSGLPAGHPTYRDTGHPEADEAAYAKAKAAYYAEKEKATDPKATEKAEMAEKERHIAEEAERARLNDIEEARKKASAHTTKSDQ